jgi:hypothetical protein
MECSPKQTRFAARMARALVLSIAVFALAAAAVAGETFTAFGDSFTEAANSWAVMVAQTKGWTLTNRAAGGSQLGDPGQADRIFEERPAGDVRYTVLTGYNDMRARGRSGLSFFRGTLEASLAHLGLLHEEKIFAADPRIVYEGAWQDVLFGTRAARGTGDPAATATVSVRGEAVYVVAERFHTGGGGMLVNVDGVEYGPFDASRNLPTNRGRGSVPFLIRINRLQAKTHKVVISKSGGSSIAFAWIAGVDRQPSTRRPLVYVGNTHADEWVCPPPLRAVEPRLASGGGVVQRHDLQRRDDVAGRWSRPDVRGRLLRLRPRYVPHRGRSHPSRPSRAHSDRERVSQSRRRTRNPPHRRARKPRPLIA